MSFAEFTYPLLQAWDWFYMYETKGIQMQIGGSDQYGNIVAGADALRYIKTTHHDPDVRKAKLDNLSSPVGFTTALLTTASGEKFGKSAGNAIWLDKDMTSVFDLYGVGVSETLHINSLVANGLFSFSSDLQTRMLNDTSNC